MVHIYRNEYDGPQFFSGRRVQFEIAKLGIDEKGNPTFGEYIKTGNKIEIPQEHLDGAVITEINTGDFPVLEITLYKLYDRQGRNYCVSVVKDSRCVIG